MRHLGKPEPLLELEAAVARRHERNKSAHGCVDFVQSEPDMVHRLFARVNLLFEEICDSVQRGDVMRFALEGANHRNN